MMTVLAVVGRSFANTVAGMYFEVMRRIAALMVGGMISATLLVLLVILLIYYLWNQNFNISKRDK